MIESVRKAIIAAGLDPDEIAAQAAQIDLSAPTRHEQARPAPVKHERTSAPLTTLAEQLGLDVGDATGVVTIRPGTKKHEALKLTQGQRLETSEIPFLQEFIAADLVTGDYDSGWEASPRGLMALGMLDYGSTARAEKGKNVEAITNREAPDRTGSRGGHTASYEEGAADATRANAAEYEAVVNAIMAHLAENVEVHADDVAYVPVTQRNLVGIAFRALAEAGMIEPTGEHRASKLPAAHGRKSYVYRAKL